MAQLKVESVMEDLQQKGLSADQKRDVEKAIEGNLPPATYTKAIVFLGWATVVLVGGSILLSLLDKTVPDALRGVIGAGIGGLAGIFTGNK